jgi:HPt (histidine-containing phosphotransfer) domain-containing protein
VQPLTIHISYTDIERITQGDPRVTKDLLNVFIKQNLDNADKIKEYGAAGQWDLLRKVAHKLKSSLALVGLTEHREMAEQLERYAGEDPVATQRMVQELSLAILQVIAELTEKLKTL